MSDFGANGFVVFGGFVNGSRVNDLVGFERNGNLIDGDLLSGGKSATKCPAPRASHTSVVHNDKLYVFGGQDDDNNKLGDLWCYDFTQSSWNKHETAKDEFVPGARSGHTACVFGNKMFIFGGILELTKELNDTIVFDFNTQRFEMLDHGD